jgi:hypothetical protein
VIPYPVMLGGHDAISLLNAGSTAVTAVASVVLGVIAGIQIKHRGDKRREQSNRLDAAAKVEARWVRRGLRECVHQLDIANLHTNVASWHQQVQAVSSGLGFLEPHVLRLMELVIERHAGQPQIVDEVFQTFFDAADALNPLGAEGGFATREDEKADRMAKGRKQLLLCIRALETDFSLPELPPQYQLTPGTKA